MLSNNRQQCGHNALQNCKKKNWKIKGNNKKRDHPKTDNGGGDK